MKEEEKRSNEYHLDPNSPEILDEIIALERTNYIKRKLPAIILIPAVLALLFFQIPKIQAGGPKCDKKDSERCVKCDGMNHMNCKNRCHRGCCGCPDGSDPVEGKCARDEYQGDPEQGGEPQ